MNQTIYLDSVDQYNQLYGLETKNPLVSVINLNKATRKVNYTRWNYGVYALYLKLEKACDISYGRQTYDYQEGTIVCFAPGQTTETIPTTNKVQINALGLLFHPDFLKGSSLGKNIHRYTFFSYEVNEALHVSQEERDILIHSLNLIEKELEHDIDKYSRTLILNHIETLLNYCMRFYERQFLTRSRANGGLLPRFGQMLNAYFDDSQAEHEGLPTVKYFADKVCLSPNYFGDMLKKESGRTPQEIIQDKIIEIAKERITHTKDTVSQIAYSLGFQYPQHFCRQFRKHVGCTPGEYRRQQAG